jgi:membrane protease YdiL (CAAX protease family)
MGTGLAWEDDASSDPPLPARRNRDSRRAASFFFMFLTFGTAFFFTFFSGSLHSFLALNVLSVGVSLAYWRTGSLWMSIAMHAIFNAVTLYTLSLEG